MFQDVVYLFFDVVSAGSFTGAAKKNYMTQSAVSQAIARYEEQLGFELFDRSGYRPKLTKAGEYYYDAMISMTRHHKEILNNATRLSNQKAKVVIGFTNNFEKRFLASVLKNNRAIDPVDVSIKRYRLSEAVNLLRTRQLDLCFGMEVDFKGHRDMISYPFKQGHICVVTAKDHPLADRTSISVKELTGEPMVILVDPIHKDTYVDFMANFRLDGFVPKIIKECDDIDDFFLSVSMGEGIGYTIKELVEEEHQVHCLDLTDSHHKSSVALAYRLGEDNEYVLNFARILLKETERP